MPGGGGRIRSVGAVVHLLAATREACSARVQYFAVLADGERVTDEGHGKEVLDVAPSGIAVPGGEPPGRPTDDAQADAAQLRAMLEQELREPGDEHRWPPLLQALRGRGVTATAAQLDALPFAIEVVDAAG